MLSSPMPYDQTAMWCHGSAVSLKAPSRYMLDSMVSVLTFRNRRVPDTSFTDCLAAALGAPHEDMASEELAVCCKRSLNILRPLLKAD